MDVEQRAIGVKHVGPHVLVSSRQPMVTKGAPVGQ
jgi:hypothetical protein